MVALPRTFQTSELPDTGGNTVLIPPGRYKAVCVKSEMKDTSDKKSQYLALTFVLTEGQFANTELVERLNLVNQNQKAVEIAYKTLARISEALGMNQTPADSNQLHNKPLILEVHTEEGKAWTDRDGIQREGRPKSVIKKYHAIASPNPVTGGFPAAPQTPASKPWG